MTQRTHRPAARRSTRERAPRGKQPADYNKNDVSKILTERKLLWIGAGGPPKYAAAMAVVSFFESASEDPTVTNSIGAAGYWQIYPGNDAARTRTGNARQAVKKFNDAKKAGGTGFEPWASSEGGWGKIVDKRTGKVDGVIARQLGLTFAPNFTQRVAMGPIGDAVEKASHPLEPLVAVGELALGLTELLLTPEGQRRIIKIVMGGLVVLWALNQLSKAMFGVNPVQSASRAATKVGTAVATKGAVT